MAPKKTCYPPRGLHVRASFQCFGLKQAVVVQMLGVEESKRLFVWSVQSRGAIFNSPKIQLKFWLVKWWTVVSLGRSAKCSKGHDQQTCVYSVWRRLDLRDMNLAWWNMQLSWTPFKLIIFFPKWKHWDKEEFNLNFKFFFCKDFIFFI